jgi:hypothetical protein
LMTVHPMVRTRKKVPINSTTYLFIAALTPAKASGKLRATLKHARIVEDTGVGGLTCGCRGSRISTSSSIF